MDEDNNPELIGLGRSGRVMRFGNSAVKTANIWTVPEDASDSTIICNEQINDTNKGSLKHEGLVYRHLGHVNGVIKPSRISDTEIRMPYLRQGSLGSYLRTHSDSVSNIQQLQWLREAVHTIRRVHERRVLVADIATRNFLLDENCSLQMCDFTESVVVPNDINMDTFVSEDYFSVKFDVARFGSMMYEITSRNRFEFCVVPESVADPDEESEFMTFREWPSADRFPSTRGIFLGEIIRKCWLEDGFLTIKDVCDALDQIDLKPAAVKDSKHLEKTKINWQHVLLLASPVATTILFIFVVPRLHLPWRLLTKPALSIIWRH